MVLLPPNLEIPSVWGYYSILKKGVLFFVRNGDNSYIGDSLLLCRGVFGLTLK